MAVRISAKGEIKMEDYTRTETYLNGILNGTEVPTPYTREEQLLYQIAKSGGGLPDGSNDGDVLYWSSGAWTAGAITNIIPNGDEVSY